MANIIFSSNPLFDNDANAFLSATSITNTIQMMAINDLVVDLKSFGLWNKLNCVYPFVGGTANTHKYNLKDPRDLDVAYRLIFSGGLTHSSTGMLSNGTTGYADTKFTASTLSINSGHLSYYSRTDTAAGTRVEMGSVNGITSYFVLILKYIGSLCYGGVFDGLSNNVSNTNSTGMYIVTRINSSSEMIFKNGVSILSASTAPVLQNSATVTICGQNSQVAGIVNITNRECAFASIGSGLTSSDCVNLYSCVQKYQSYLNRQV